MIDPTLPSGGRMRAAGMTNRKVPAAVTPLQVRETNRHGVGDRIGRNAFFRQSHERVRRTRHEAARWRVAEQKCFPRALPECQGRFRGMFGKSAIHRHTAIGRELHGNGREALVVTRNALRSPGKAGTRGLQLASAFSIAARAARGVATVGGADDGGAKRFRSGLAELLHEGRIALRQRPVKGAASDIVPRIEIGAVLEEQC